MVKKSNVAKAPAEETLADLIEMEQDAPMESNPVAPQADGLTSATTLTADDEMEFSGGTNARVDIFFTHESYDGMNDATDKEIQKGDTFDGTYAGSLVAGQFKSRKHKIRVTTGEFAGKVIALPPCTKLNDEYQFAPEGVRTIVRYDGRATKAEVGPDWTGQLPYRYSVGLPKSVKANIKAGKLAKNYEVPPKQKRN